MQPKLNHGIMCPELLTGDEISRKAALEGSFMGEKAVSYTHLSLADIPLYHVSPFDVYYDDGLAMIGTFIDNNKWPENGYYDFDTGKITLIEFESENTFSIRRTSEVGYDGQGYSAFLLPDEREDGYGWELGVLDHDTCEVKENILTIQNAQAQVIGVLADGRVMVYYRVNSAEQGLLVTPPPR